MSSDPDQQDALRNRDRTPHPYHRHSAQLPHSSEHAPNNINAAASPHVAYLSPPARASFSHESTAGSESGTEADDEHFLRGLPASKVKLHKGLRGSNEPISGVSTPIPSPAFSEFDHVQNLTSKMAPSERLLGELALDVLRRNRNLVRRVAEAAIVGFLGYVTVTSTQASPIVRIWSKGMS